MARPSKMRRICGMPTCRRFAPTDEIRGGLIEMTVDEFESVRLIDLEGMTQEQCALQMNVARTTVQAIYSTARHKLADCLVNGCELAIGGGDYTLCSGDAITPCHGRRCGKCPQHSKKISEYIERNTIMKIAVTYENGKIFEHFGHTEQFKLYSIENGKVTSVAVVGTNGSGHGALAEFLKEHGVDTLICGGIGGGARQALAQAGIRLFGGVSGGADEAVSALLNETPSFDPDAACTHHEEHGGEACGEHSCGEHGHHCGE